MVRRARAGYTLIEIMVVVAILGIMSGVGANLILQVNRMFLLTRSRSDLQREARAAMYIITRELRQATSASIVTDRFNSAQPFYSRITFTTFSGRTMSFYQSGNLLVSLIGNNKTILSNHVGYLAFTFPQSDDLTIMSVSMTLTENLYNGRVKSLHMASEKVQVMN